MLIFDYSFWRKRHDSNGYQIVIKNCHKVQCWFKLTKQIALNLKFKTRFSQIGLSLGENVWKQNLLKILAELIWWNLFCEIWAQNFTPKMGHFGFS